MGKTQKQEYLEKFLAHKIKEGTVKTTIETTKKISGVMSANSLFQWMTKKQMIDLWGPEKTEGKLKSGVATLPQTSPH
eukprot:4625823-Pyramimonas_sp.AAC.1